jgi:putative tricarboxylic transport membrane protein
MSSPTQQRRPERAAFVIAMALAGLGAILIREALIIPDRSGYAGVGPSGMPWAVGWGLVVLAVWTVIDALRLRFGTADKSEVVPVLWILSGLGLQIVTLRPLGFTIASALLFACTAFSFGKRNLMLTLPVGLVFALIVYAIFDQLLKLNLPHGPIETLLFGG